MLTPQYGILRNANCEVWDNTRYQLSMVKHKIITQNGKTQNTNLAILKTQNAPSVTFSDRRCRTSQNRFTLKVNVSFKIYFLCIHSEIKDTQNNNNASQIRINTQ